MKVLVTGGMGYLGSVLVEQLVNEGFRVKVLDNLLFGDSLSGSGVEFEFMRGDIRDEKVLQEAVNGAEAVVHLAAIVGEPAANVDKEAAVHVNYLATRKLAEICRKLEKRLVFLSTCSVYGAQPDELLTESSPVSPLAVYAITKLAAEEAIEKLNGKRSVMFRLGTLFGSSRKMRFDLVVNRFIAQAVQDRKITVFGGSQYRPFTHVRDVVGNIIKVLDSSVTGVYNLGGMNYRIGDMAKIIEEKTGCEVVVYKELEDPRNYSVDSSRAIQDFGAKFTRNVEYGVDEIKQLFTSGTVKDYRDSSYDREKWLRRTT